MKHSQQRPSSFGARPRPHAKSRRFDGKSAGGTSEKRFYPAKAKARFEEPPRERREADSQGKPRRHETKSSQAFGEKRFYSAKPKTRFDEASGERRDSNSRFRERTFASDIKPKSKKYFSDKKHSFRPDSRSDRPTSGPEERQGYEHSIRGRFKTSALKDRGFGEKRRTSSANKSQRSESQHDRYKTLAPNEKPSDNNDVLWGLHAVRAAWLNSKRKCSRLWLTEAGQKIFAATLTEAAENLLLTRPTFKLADRNYLDQLTPSGSVHQGIVLEAAPLHELNLHDVISGDHPADVLLMLDQVTDPHNVGAILRSAAALGAGAVIMTERNAPNTTGVLAKSASGAVEYIPQIHVVNLARALDDLQNAGYWCVGLAEEGEKNLSSLDLSSRVVLVLGAEGSGLRQLTRKKCNELARLPTGGPIGSLNVSNAAAVALYETHRQKSKFQK